MKKYEHFDRTYRKNLIEHPELSGYFQHPVYKDIYCSRVGTILDRKGNVVFCSNLDKYYHTTVENGKTNLIHKLVIQTFLEVPNPCPSPLLCNHINGIKGDFRLDNLEWSSYKGNTEHAYMSGLRDDNVHILVKDLRTGEIKDFYSISACGRHFNVSHGRIRFILDPKKYGLPQFKYYLFIKKGETWPIGGPELIGTNKQDLYRTIVVYDIEKKSFTIYDTQLLAAVGSGVPEYIIYRRFRKIKSAGKIQFEEKGKIFMKVIDFEMNRFFIPGADKTKITKVDYIHCKTKSENKLVFSKPKPIIVTDLETGIEERYESSEIFARKIGVKKNSLQKHILLNAGVWKNKLKITYVIN